MRFRDPLPYSQLAATTARIRPTENPGPAASDAMVQGLLVVARIPYDLWDYLTAWLITIKWTTINGAKTECTWIELLLAFAPQSGYRFLQLDMCDALAVFTAACRKVLRAVHKSGAIHMLCGLRPAGIDRRPMLSKATWRSIATKIRDAACGASTEIASFGRGEHRVDLPRDSILECHVAATAATQQGRNVGTYVLPFSRPCMNRGPCALGCTASKDWHRLPPAWSVAAADTRFGDDPAWQRLMVGMQLCDAHYLQACRIIMRVGDAALPSACDVATEPPQ